MSVSDDIGSIVLTLADRMIERYDSEAPRRYRENVERYFEQVEYLLRHTKDAVAFSKQLSSFQRSVTELTKSTCEELGDAVDGQKLVTYFMTTSTLLGAGVGVYALFTGQGDMTIGGFVAAGALLIGQGYMCLKQHDTRNLYKRLVRCDKSTHHASVDEWREAFTHYHPALTEEMIDFRHMRDPTTLRHKCKAKV